VFFRSRAFVTAIKSESATERANQARIGFANFTSNLKGDKGDLVPDLIALVDARPATKGQLIAMSDVASVVAKQWTKEGGQPGETIIPALNVVMNARVILSDMWNDGGHMMRIGVAPVIDPDAVAAADNPEGVVIIGAVLVAYAQTADQARQDKRTLGTEIAYYDNGKVTGTGFTEAPNEEEPTKGAPPSGPVSSTRPDSRFLTTSRIVNRPRIASANVIS